MCIRHDVSEALPALPPVSEVYHLASPASPAGYSRLPIETLRANAAGTDNLLALAAANDARFLYASTSEAYGDPLVHPQPEDYRGNVSSIGPRSMYDEGKRYGEALTMAWVRSRGVDGRIVRIFNTFGPRMQADDGRLVPTMMMRALRGEPLPVHGDGRQTRSLCYVIDTVAAMLEAIAEPCTRGEVVNIGSPEEHTVLEYALMIRAMTGSASEVRFVPHDVGDDPQRRCPDIMKAERMLGWRPVVSLEEGLSRTCDWFRAKALATTVHGAE
jgi:nucleoside-diphosphate-sugar epimerase